MSELEKAIEILNKMYNSVDDLHKYPMCFQTAKQCALILIDEIIEATKKYVVVRERTGNTRTGFENVVHTVYDPFWIGVKKELINLKSIKP